MKKLLFLSFCLIWLPLFSSAQIIQGESTTTQTLFVPEKKIPEKGYPRYQGDIYLGYAGDDICLSSTTTHGIRQFIPRLCIQYRRILRILLRCQYRNTTMEILRGYRIHTP